MVCKGNNYCLKFRCVYDITQRYESSCMLYVYLERIPNDFVMLIQIPKSDATSSADEVEVFMYKHMFEYLQCYAERTSRKKNEIQMPIPIGTYLKIHYLTFTSYFFLYIMTELLNIKEFFFSVFHSHFSENVKGRNQLVMENLRDQEYKVRKMKISYDDRVQSR